MPLKRDYWQTRVKKEGVKINFSRDFKANTGIFLQNSVIFKIESIKSFENVRFLGFVTSDILSFRLDTYILLLIELIIFFLNHAHTSKKFLFKIFKSTSTNAHHDSEKRGVVFALPRKETLTKFLFC